MSEKLYFRAPSSSHWSRAINHFKHSNYHVEVGEKYYTLAVSVPEAHRDAALHIVSDYNLVAISKEVFDTFKKEMLVPVTVVPTAKITEKVTLCPGCGKPAVRFHGRYCLKFQQYIKANKQDIVKDAVNFDRSMAAKKWRIAHETVTLFVYEAGLIKVDELQLAFRKRHAKRLGLVKQPAAPPAAVSRGTAEPRPTPAPQPTAAIRPTTVQIVEAVGWLIQRRNELEEENKKLKAELFSLAEVLSKRKEQDKILASLRDLLGK